MSGRYYIRLSIEGSYFMAACQTASKTLDSEFLGMRCRLIDLAASLDRIGRHDGPTDDPRMKQIRRALEILASDGSDRAERVQLEFSLLEQGLGLGA